MIKIWDKKEKINGVSADYVLESHRIQKNDEIFLVINDVTSKVTEIQNKLTIAGIYNIDPNLTTLEVGEEYLRIKAEEEEKQKLEQITIEQQAEKIKELEQGQANTEYILMEGGLI
nr:hypothetical protein [Clostridioides sp.]